ncbi:hypothetical protein, partial [Klebsiella pneumoniae]|uniref:hypothetical protein n=1 Tax=Klebsiella pneumoniae TaxID=573 RepID=UPI0019536540
HTVCHRKGITLGMQPLRHVGSADATCYPLTADMALTRSAPKTRAICGCRWKNVIRHEADRVVAFEKAARLPMQDRLLLET